MPDRFAAVCDWAHRLFCKFVDIDVEHAFEYVIRFTTSRSTKRPALFGYALDGRTIFVAYDTEEDDGGNEVIFVTTAFEVGTP